ncbi:MAG: hypothetical protein QXO12_02515 [Candidatus Pacearchaeota archaeon]
MIKKKAIGFFSYLLVLATLILYSFALIKIGTIEKSKIVKSFEKIEDLDNFNYYIDNFDNYLNLSYQISYYNSIYNFSNYFDKSEKCKIIYLNDIPYFSMDCNFDKNIFLDFLNKSFNEYIKNYLDYGKEIYNFSYEFSCKIDNIVRCNIFIYKNFNMDIMNMSLKKEKKFEQQIDFKFLEEFQEIKEKLKNSEIYHNEFEIEKNEDKNYIYTKIKLKKKFLVVGDILSKQIELRFYHEK